MEGISPQAYLNKRPKSYGSPSSISGTRLEVKLVLAKFSPNALFQAF